MHPKVQAQLNGMLPKNREVQRNTKGGGGERLREGGILRRTKTLIGECGCLISRHLWKSMTEET